MTKDDDRNTFSYTSLVEAEACPARLQLAHRAYPTLWDRQGFPSRTNYAALKGSIIHRCVQMFVNTLTEMPDVDGKQEQALRAVGGISQLVTAASEEELNEAQKNPRSRALIKVWERKLNEDEESLRLKVQGLLRMLPDVAQRISGAETSREASSLIRKGTYSEFWLESRRARIVGSADLLNCQDPHDRIVDFKTGERSETHEAQVRLYAAMWLEDERNANSRPVSMAASYADSDVEFGQLHPEDAPDVLDWWKQRSDQAELVLGQESVLANPAPELCSTCRVKPACDTYWQDLVPRESLFAKQFFDVELVLVEQLGSKTWRIQPIAAPSGEIPLVLNFDWLPRDLATGDRLRLLGVQFRPESDEASAIARVGRNTEVFALRSDGLFLVST